MQADNCRVRPVEAADLEQMLLWRNHPQVRAYMLKQHEISLAEHTQWFERASQDASRRLMIVEEAGAPLGFVSFADADAGGIATWGFYAAPDAAKGAGRKIGSAALAFAFTALALHKVCGQALAFNEASIRMHQKLGFRQEGVLRQQHRMAGGYQDVICFGLLKDEWNMESGHSK